MSEKTYSLEMTIRTLLENKRYSSIKDILITLNAADIAAIFAELEPDILPLLFRLLPKELAADTFVEMDPDQQQLLITRFSDTELKEVIDELYIDDAVDLVEEMPANVVKRILYQADPETRKLINELLKYPEDSAGSIMTTEFVELGMGYTVEDAIKTIRRTGLDKETINDCFVTGPGRKLEGIISIRSLILAQDDDKVSDIMDTNVVSVNTMDDQETVAEKFKKYDLTAMPVVDGENRLVGMVTVMTKVNDTDNATRVPTLSRNMSFKKLMAERLAPQRTATRTSFQMTVRMSLKWISFRERPRMMVTEAWLPELPPVSMSMGI
ncbi:MAG: magnesium transporter [Clostridia bacterium]|nr:magnesium transporter [Clostridia bacterium]